MVAHGDDILQVLVIAATRCAIVADIVDDDIAHGVHLNRHVAACERDVDVLLLVAVAEMPLGLFALLADGNEAISAVAGQTDRCGVEVDEDVVVEVGQRCLVAFDERKRLVGIEDSPADGTGIVVAVAVEDLSLHRRTVLTHVLTSEQFDSLFHIAFGLLLDADDSLQTTRKAGGRTGISHAAPTREIVDEWVQNAHIEPAVASATPSPVDIEETIARTVAVDKVGVTTQLVVVAIEEHRTTGSKLGINDVIPVGLAIRVAHDGTHGRVVAESLHGRYKGVALRARTARRVVGVQGICHVAHEAGHIANRAVRGIR